MPLMTTKARFLYCCCVLFTRARMSDAGIARRIVHTYRLPYRYGTGTVYRWSRRDPVRFSQQSSVMPVPFEWSEERRHRAQSIIWWRRSHEKKSKQRWWASPDSKRRSHQSHPRKFWTTSMLRLLNTKAYNQQVTLYPSLHPYHLTKSLLDSKVDQAQPHRHLTLICPT